MHLQTHDQTFFGLWLSGWTHKSPVCLITGLFRMGLGEIFSKKGSCCLLEVVGAFVVFVMCVFIFVSRDRVLTHMLRTMDNKQMAQFMCVCLFVCVALGCIRMCLFLCMRLAVAGVLVASLAACVCVCYVQRVLKVQSHDQICVEMLVHG